MKALVVVLWNVASVLPLWALLCLLWDKSSGAPIVLLVVAAVLALVGLMIDAGFGLGLA